MADRIAEIDPKDEISPEEKIGLKRPMGLPIEKSFTAEIYSCI
jgi:hypothetical protein